MKKVLVLFAVLGGALFIALNHGKSGAPLTAQEPGPPSATQSQQDQMSESAQSATQAKGSKSSANETTENHDPFQNKARAVSGQESAANGQATQSTSSSSAPKASPSPSPSLAGIKVADDGGPSIGTIKVLGHRGCDTNTQGWFLSVGNPEQYDFTVSDDGETVVVSPNVPQPTGNFEFVHCVDMGQVMEKKVRMTAQIKAEGVTQTANLRLRGEDLHRKKIVGGETLVGGTHDWKEYSVDGTIGRDVALFSYGLTFKSVGKLWISHPTLMVIP